MAEDTQSRKHRRPFGGTGGRVTLSSLLLIAVPWMVDGCGSLHLQKKKKNIQIAFQTNQPVSSWLLYWNCFVLLIDVELFPLKGLGSIEIAFFYWKFMWKNNYENSIFNPSLFIFNCAWNAISKKYVLIWVIFQKLIFQLVFGFWIKSR